MSTPPDDPSRDTDSISIRHLQLPHGLIAPDVWGNPKEQPVLISLKLGFHANGFDTAAGSDKLDASTIHYGNLAKRLRAGCKQGLTVDEWSHDVESIVGEMARKEQDRFIVETSILEVHLPKASMYGEGVAVKDHVVYEERYGVVQHWERTFALRDVKIMTLVGVNEYERKQRQPLVVTCELRYRPQGSGPVEEHQRTTKLFALEATLAKIIEETSFETLETLAEHTVTHLRATMLDALLEPGSQLCLRVEKPRAIAFAHAPAVEVVRVLPMKDTSVEANAHTTLRIMKPYADTR